MEGSAVKDIVLTFLLVLTVLLILSAVSWIPLVWR
jgi:hypothetical protein